MELNVEDFVRDWSYLGVFLGIIATGAGFPMPEELPVVIGGALAGKNLVYPFLMLPVCICGVIVGDSILYGVGRLWGKKLIERPFIQKHVVTPERMERITQNFEKYGIKILLFARLTPGIRAPIFLTAGTTRLSLIRFLIADAVYAIPGVSLLFSLGYVFTDQMVALIESKLERIKSYVILFVVVLVAGYVAYRFFRNRVITGNPREMPPLANTVALTIDQVTNKVLSAPVVAPGPQPTSESHADSQRPDAQPTPVTSNPTPDRIP